MKILVFTIGAIIHVFYSSFKNPRALFQAYGRSQKMI